MTTGINVLGVLRVEQGNQDVTPSAPRKRQLFALLTLSPNIAISTDRLIEEIWPEGVPGTALPTIQTYVYEIRRALQRSADPTGSTPLSIETQGDGYALRMDPNDLDCTRFEALLTEGRKQQAKSSPAVVATMMTDAIACWQGEAYSGVRRTRALEARARYLGEQRRQAFELKVDSYLATGQHRQVIGELKELSFSEPAHEWVEGRLMVALAGCGRRTEALEVYQAHRSYVRDKLGLEPSQHMVDLQHRILSGTLGNRTPALRPTAGANTSAASSVTTLPIGGAA
ncbi:MAG TPA: AfsR/SARP family transcriptional regulator [Pseudonocardiaceae bacterium]|nr:AfsR/SARP family transcriptional regulator [Pseudonocardiaceae bacterium]